MTATAPATTATTGTVPSPAASRRTGAALWAAQITLALFLVVASGVPKLAGVPAAAESFDLIGYGDWFMYLVGLLEIAGAVGLVIPRLAGPAALALIGLMAGAEIFIWLYLDTTFWYTPLVFAALFAWIAHGRRASTARLLRRPHRRAA
ncbi:DoxX family protein [Allostreptomyces psammosilenae]|uniref:Putative membrane protein YphA (DoxX/SURF4 family) n=1 Tax=Allostreptomyces psammosilenae TaxID=1892865 RepID=A0A853A288_9ACTN|nr:DoxX family protein [Allostreptomyces psammosilenae]NYI04632.1 putative membrane protein YphA (DoxX/SURF4 family) [Allostreptomyces psammosilenae]